MNNKLSKMTKQPVENIALHPNFLLLTRVRRRVRIQLTSLIVLAFSLYIVAWSFFPDVINTRVPQEGPITLGIWFTLIIIVLGITLSGYYTFVIGTKMDKLCQQLARDFDHE